MNFLKVLLFSLVTGVLFFSNAINAFAGNPPDWRKKGKDKDSVEAVAIADTALKVNEVITFVGNKRVQDDSCVVIYKQGGENVEIKIRTARFIDTVSISAAPTNLQQIGITSVERTKVKKIVTGRTIVGADTVKFFESFREITERTLK